MSTSELSGTWTYRSFNPTYVTGNQTPEAESNLIFADDVPPIALKLELMTNVSYARAPLKGTIDWSGGGLDLSGTTRVYGRTDPLYGEFQSLDFVGTGRPGTATDGWEYRYHGYFEGRWPPFRGEVAIPLNQHLTIVGSVIRVKDHNGRPDGWRSPAGAVASFIAVKQPGQPPGFPGLWNYRSFKNEKAAVYPTTALQRTQPQAHELLLQEAVFKLETPTSTTLQGAIEWLGGSLDLKMTEVDRGNQPAYTRLGLPAGAPSVAGLRGGFS